MNEKGRFPDAFLETMALRFRLLGEPMRLRILQALMAGEKTVGELVEICQSTQANISRHLQVLALNGILSRRKNGLHVHYRIADPTIPKLCRYVCDTLQETLQKPSLPTGNIDALFRS